MGSTHKLARWVSSFGILLLLGALGCTVWAEFSAAGDRLQATTLGAICGFSGCMMVCLGVAYSRIGRLEDQVRELQQSQASRVERVSAEPSAAADRPRE